MQRQGETDRDRYIETGRDRERRSEKTDRERGEEAERERQGLGNLYCGTPAATGEVF